VKVWLLEVSDNPTVHSDACIIRRDGKGRPRSLTFPMPALTAGSQRTLLRRLTAIPVAVPQSGRAGPIHRADRQCHPMECQRRAGGTESKLAWNAGMQKRLTVHRSATPTPRTCWSREWNLPPSSSPCARGHRPSTPQPATPTSPSGPRSHRGDALKRLL